MDHLCLQEVQQVINGAGPLELQRFQIPQN